MAGSTRKSDHDSNATCNHGAQQFWHPGGMLNRRTMIQAGSIGLLGLGMNHVSALRAMGASKNGSREKQDRQPAARDQSPRAKSVIYIFLSGGLAQQESFDPKPEGPAETRGEFGAIKTKTKGIHICEHLPELAKRSDKWALVRSLTHPHNEHSDGHVAMLTGHTKMPRGFDRSKPKPSDWPSIAAIANDRLVARNNLPPAIVLPDKIVHRTGRVIPGQFAGQMGARRDPWFVDVSPYHPEHYGAYPDYLFHHAKGKQADPRLKFQMPSFDLPQGLTKKRVRDRDVLRKTLETQRRYLDEAAERVAFDRYRQAAIDLLMNGRVHDAFDLSKVDANRQQAYGRNSFGKSLLMAAQLVEAGVSLVQVNLGNNETWDTHQGAFRSLKNYLLPPMDKAVSALLDDLDARGLLDETLIVMASEFGRTPRIFKIPKATTPGRDHWGACQSVFFAGGGVKGGNVVGKSDKQGGYPTESPQRPENLAATIYDALGLPRTAAWYDQLDRPNFVYHGDSIAGLM
jgi:hypothetical protein